MVLRASWPVRPSPVAGLVVEHNYSQAWSGVVFRRTDDLVETPAAKTPDATDDTTTQGGAGQG